MADSGHKSMKEVQRYTKKADRRLLSDSADEKMRAEMKGPAGQPLLGRDFPSAPYPP
jgi:hypothetical protein